MYSMNANLDINSRIYASEKTKIKNIIAKL